jgi:RimJ/RimL family protein N-acetyltransferase
LANHSTSGVRLRDVTEEDLPTFFEQQIDVDAIRMAAFPARDRDAFMAHWHTISDDASVIAKTVVVEGDVAGNVVSFEQSGERLVGYWIGQRFWGHGVATRALALFLESISVRPLFAHVAEHNVGSIRVLEKCGFARVDHASHETDVDGVVEVVLKLDSVAPPGPLQDTERP